MRLRVLEHGRWQVVAPLDVDRDDCPVAAWLAAMHREHPKAVEGLLHLLRRAATDGPMHLGDTLCHQVDAGARVFEFIKGRLRLLWFYGEGARLVVCSHGFLKASQRTPRAEIARAVACATAYRAAVEADEIAIEGNAHER